MTSLIFPVNLGLCVSLLLVSHDYGGCCVGTLFLGTVTSRQHRNDYTIA